MRLHFAVVLFLTLPFLLTSCYREDKMDNTPYGNFEALWKILDEGYCYFDYKEIDWDAIYDEYSQKITNRMSQEELFEVLGEMTRELKDGHVNLSSTFNTARYWEWYEDYPRNFSEEIVEKYLGVKQDYQIAGGLKYRILEDNVGYIYYSSFMSPISESNISQALNHLALCKGLIIDIRNNGGGNITNSTRLAARFTNEEIVTGYIMHKRGKGHSDFSTPYPIKIKPSKRIRWQKKVVVLTNRHTYSAANDFTNNMRYMPNVTIMGDKTGGGGGLAYTSELPNGWSVRFSASPHLDADKKHIEFGIDPDIKIDLDKMDMIQGIDSMIEAARKLF